MYLFNCVIAIEFDYHAVDSLNVKHELQSKRVSCRHFQTIFLGFPLEIVFYFLHELKQRGSDVTGCH